MFQSYLMVTTPYVYFCLKRWLHNWNVKIKNFLRQYHERLPPQKKDNLWKCSPWQGFISEKKATNVLKQVWV